MAEKIEDNFGAHQRLLADVSHELRSPMTRLQIALGLAAKCKTEPDILQRHLSRCELEVTRLDQMINDVLCLSSLENNTQNNWENLVFGTLPSHFLGWLGTNHPTYWDGKGTQAHYHPTLMQQSDIQLLFYFS